MTDVERRAILLPHGRDADLEPGWYWYRHNDRVIKVCPMEVLPSDSPEHEVEFVVYARRGARLYPIETALPVTMGLLYDNKDDCREGTHDLFDDWERLRAL